MARTKVTDSQINVKTTTDANGWTIVNLGAISLASKTYSFEVGAVGAGGTANLGGINDPSSGTILHRSFSWSISSQAPFFTLAREVNTIYIRNNTSGSVDPGTIRLDFIYIMTN